MNKSKRINEYIFGILIVSVSFAFFTYYLYHNEFIGDDILCNFTGCLTYYLDDYEFNLGHRISTIKDVFDCLAFTYKYWSGRMPGYLLNFFGKILPKIAVSLIGAFIYVCNSLLICRLIFKNLVTVFKNVIVFIIVLIVMYWSKPYVYFSYMWTMTSIYGFSILLCLLYYNIYLEWKSNYTLKRIFFMQVLGFLAGFSHEALSLCLILMIAYDWCVSFVNKKTKFSSVFAHTSIGIGYIFCFFAPGNFYRRIQKHDKTTNSIFRRLLSSGYNHLKVFLGSYEQLILALIIVFLVIFVVYKLWRYKRIKFIFDFLLENFAYVICCIVSVLVYGILPSCPPYGLDLWMAVVLIVLFKFIYDSQVIYKIIDNRIGVLITTGTILLFFIVFHHEIKSKTQIYDVRCKLISDAIVQRENNVSVPKYDSILSDNRCCLDYLNNQKHYDTEYYIKFWGIHIKINE